MGKRKKQAIKDIDTNVVQLDEIIEDIPQCKKSLTALKNKFKDKRDKIASQIGKKHE